MYGNQVGFSLFAVCISIFQRKKGPCIFFMYGDKDLRAVLDFYARLLFLYLDAFIACNRNKAKWRVGLFG